MVCDDNLIGNREGGQRHHEGEKHYQDDGITPQRMDSHMDLQTIVTWQNRAILQEFNHKFGVKKPMV